MSLLGLLAQDVTVTPVTTGGSDAMGNPTDVLGAPTVYKGRLQEISAEEVTVGRDTAVSNWAVYLPAAASVVSHRDLVSVDGLDFEIWGAPYPVMTPTGLHHVKARLRLLEG